MMERDPSQDDEEIKSGTLYKKGSGFGVGARRWSEKWFVLTGKNLLWYNTKKDRSSKKKPKGSISLEKLAIKSGTDNDPNLNDAPKGFKCCFNLVNSTDSSCIFICAQGEEDMSFWMDVLNSAASGRKDLTKETVAIQEELRKTGVQEIPSEALSFDEEVIGSGASGIVKRGLWLKSTEVAVKVLKNVPEFTDRRDLLSFYKEIETLSKLRHSNIVQMYGFCKKESYLCLVTEYVRGGNLADCLEDIENYELDFYMQIELGMNIVRGMVYLHNQNVIHRDLKPANILIESWEEGKVKVCDFGISRVVKKNTEQGKSGDALGSPQYAAPELNSDFHDNKVDVFSFSIILWEIALRKSPWPELKFGSQFAEKYQKKERPLIPDDSPFKQLIEKCWSHSPSERPSFVQIYEALENIKKGTADLNKPVQTRVKSFTGVNGGKKESPIPVRSQSSLSLNMKDIPVKVLPNNPNANGLKAPQKKPSSGTLSTSSGSLSPGTTRYNTMSSSSNGLIPKTSPPIQHSKPISASNMQPKTAAEATIWKLFANKNAETWEVFAQTFQVALATDSSSVQKLKFVFEKDGLVERQTWETFLIWFSPLDVNEIYQTNGGCKGGYEIEHILQVCTPVWFHGFLSSADAQKALKGKNDGSFLFRFSTTNPGCYALTVAYSNTVGHWRISCEKKPFEVPVFLIDGRQYRSLEDIIQTHRFGREALNIKSPKPGQATSCFLGSYHPREEELDNQYYQNVQVKRDNNNNY